MSVSIPRSTGQPLDSKQSFYSRNDLRSVQSKVKKDIEENFEIDEELEVCEETM
jgi:hypothetical protein